MIWVNLNSLWALCTLSYLRLLELRLHLEMIELTRLHGLGSDDLVDERSILHGRGQPRVSLSKFFSLYLVFELDVLLYRFNFWCQSARIILSSAIFSLKFSAIPQDLAPVIDVC